MDFRPVHAINVNGPVAPTDLSDRAKIESVNGALDVQFARGPSEECTIATINGGLPTGTGLDANTEHNDGDIESDFDVEPMMLPAKIEREERAMIDMVIASYSRPVCAWAQAVRHSPSARSMAISEFVITSEREHQENVCVCRAAQLVCWGGAGLEFWGVRTREAIVRRTTHKPTGRRCSLLRVAFELLSRA